MQKKELGPGFEQLCHAYRCLQTGSCPGVSAGALASLACARLSEGGAAGAGGSLEVTGLSLTLVRKVSSSLMAGSLPPEAASYFEETLKILSDDLGLMSHLVGHFKASDQVLLHLAVKSVSTCVTYHLHHHGVVSPVWEQSCLRTFALAVPGTELDACVWSLTEALKTLLKGAFRGDTGKLLSRFDSSLGVLCSTLLSEDQSKIDLREFGTTLCFLMDLLEALAASALVCGAMSCLQCQTLIYLHSPALLKVISFSSDNFVKKRLLLLLKRVVLQKAGEEWTSGDASVLNLKNHDSVTTLLTQSVLTAVGAHWLDSLQVETSSSFWGTEPMHDGALKPNYVVLRAVSLLLLKSMEIHIKTTPSRGLPDISELCGHLQKLWAFLKSHNVPLMEQHHRCCWVGLLFGDQDDDMMEAAKALLSIFLSYRQCSELNGPTLLEEACSYGYNPHCHFILLLESIAFDHSFLLDLLISTETCFLEYLVQYLKCLLADWHGFRTACGRTFTGCPSKSPLSSLSASARTTSIPKPPCHPSSMETNSAGHGLHLVDYSSSDESDHENAGPHNGTLMSSIRALDITEDGEKMADSAGLPSQFTDSKESPEKGSDVSCEISTRVLVCLSELREVVMRLHVKKLFPYNPTPLLKLLGQVEACSLQTH